MYTLKINTSGQICEIALKKSGKNIFKKTWTASEKTAKYAFEILKSLIKKYPDLRENISKIEVNKGPGSFTGTRIGVTIANTIGFLMGEKKIIAPVYATKPKITKAKKKHLKI
ncbi:MAG: hypothetical protein UT33_C0009G0003 [Candidatus Peregrinibacteria bacterium GW2011_GWC2_39_14]|nr:MAG: Universal bacterial protein YeaZ [Candidatus Peregrinibacteria bacterium GW2011_GWA2_38_36]KKR06552.1 MAG: hypothetical protein UT33_C0009G0003 [Candidatus Peregrinibacteria bacterium GW2011_GWC2_39_14]